MYPPFFTDRALIMSIESVQRAALSQSFGDRPIVRAAGILCKDSSTDVVDVNRLTQNTTAAIQYIEIADSNGRLYCVNAILSTPCWLKIVTLAKDCQSCNVLLISTNDGVMLKTARYIAPGEPLLMWFTEHIIAFMNMPFLTPSHIQGQRRYICHLCHCMFEYPNPLKIHLALNCDRLDVSHLWSVLANEFNQARRRNLALNLSFFEFELTHPPPRPLMPRISPILVESTDSSNLSLTNNSPSSSNHPSPSPSSSSSSSNRPSLTYINQAPSTSSNNQPSPSSSFNEPSSSSFNRTPPSSSFAQISPSSSSQTSPPENVDFRQSAFKPYWQKNDSMACASVCPPPREEEEEEPFNSQPNPPPLPADVHAAQMEAIVSTLGKSKQGHLCLYCGKVYSRKYGLKIHIRTHTGYKPLKCKYCDRPFGDPSNLNKHVRLHAADGDTPYRCEICGKILVRRRDLERHIRSRHQNNVEEAGATDSSSDSNDV